MPDYLPPIGSPNSPLIIPSLSWTWDTYFGCSMINSNYINFLLCAIAQASPTLNAMHAYCIVFTSCECVCTFGILTFCLQSQAVAMSSRILHVICTY